MKHFARLLSLVLLTAASPAVLHADTFNFSFTGNSSVSGDPGTPFSGSGVFTANEVGNTDKYKITGVTGTTMGKKIAALVPVGGFGSNDNLLFFTAGAASAMLDNSGVSYKLADGVLANLILNTNAMGQQQLFGFTSSLISEEQVATVSITPTTPMAPTPEPGTFALLGTGALGLLSTLRRRLAR